MTRNDRRSAIGAILIGLFALVGIWLLRGADDLTTVDVGKESFGNDKVSSAASHRSRGGHQYSRHTHRQTFAQENAVTIRRFPFDPNTADSTQLLQLGLQPWQVRSLYRYRQHGGVFRKKEDFARLYGLTVKQYRELEPYIRISSDYLPASTLVAAANHEERDTIRFPQKIKENERVVLNTADTSELKRVPGIGSFFAKEIVRHGKWLGGYVSVDQLDEIENFPQKAKQYFIIRDAHPVQLKVNQLSLTELRRHPYLNFYQAKAIVEYRRLHGPLQSLQDLRLLKEFTPEVLARLEPYVDYE